MASFQETKIFVEECAAELQKVTWPDYEQARNATWVIIVFVLLVSAVIWIMDWGARNGIDLIMGVFGA